MRKPEKQLKDAQMVMTQIIIFAKYPEAGRAKTRLQPALGKAGSAQMARKLLLHTVTQAVATGFEVMLCVSPDPDDSCWQELPLPTSLKWSAQVAGDLGERMTAATTAALANGEQVLLIGTDCPDLTTDMLHEAAQRLAEHNAVVIPAFDGGYVLLGLRQLDASIFQDIVWSTATVAQLTVQKIKALGWSLAMLKPLHDIDEPEDLQYLPEGW